jgi:hypothetical protein
MALQNTSLTPTAANIFVSSGSNGVTTMYFANYGGSSVTLNLYAVPNGGTAGTGTIIYTNVPIAAYDTYVVDVEKLVLGNGDRLVANVSTASVTATVSTMGL